MGKVQITDIVGGETHGSEANSKLKEIFREHNASPERYTHDIVQQYIPIEGGDGTTPSTLAGTVLINRLLGSTPGAWTRTDAGKFTFTKAGAFACGVNKMAVNFSGFKANSIIDWFYVNADSIRIETYDSDGDPADGILTAAMKCRIYIETFSYIET